MTFQSPWLASEPTPREYPGVSDDFNTEVLVIGGGITGVSAAHHLAELGADVAIIEARSISAGVTGNSSAKLSALHGVAYSKIEDAAGTNASRAYAELNRTGMDLITATAEKLGIDCGLKRRAARTYTASPDQLAALESEAEAARRAGLEVRSVADHGLPFEVAGCIEAPGQAQFNPVAWARGIASRLADRGVEVFEDSRAVDVSSGEPCTVRLANGCRIMARRVIIATHLPFLDRGLQFMRLPPKASHAIAVENPGRPDLPMYINIDSPTRSIRVIDSAETGGPELLFIGGDSHRIGEESSEPSFDDLEDLARSDFKSGPVLYRWMAHDYIP